MPDFIDDALPTDKQLQDMEDSGNSAGDATKDFQDDDQDAKDKAKNVTKGGTEALDKLGDATGIGALKDAADAIDDATDAVWGPDLPLDGNGDPILPPVHIRVYFGEKGMVDSLKDDLIADGLEAADNLVAAGMAEAKSALGKDVPILGELAEDPFTSFLSPKDKDEDESHWIVRAFDLSEGLNETFRLELDLVRIEERSANEPPATATNADGGFIDKIKSAVATGQAMVQQAQGMVQQAQGVVQQLGQVDEVGDLVDIASGLIPGDSGPGTDGPVPQINIPLDPKVFLNQTISVAISRDFGDQSTKNSAPDLYRYPFVKRWITGVITEFEDLGVLRGPASAAVIQAGGLAAEGFARAVHVVVEPSLAKLRLRKNHRIWTDYTALEVVQSVLREASIYGLLPAIPGATLVTDGLTEVVDGIPFAGDALASTASGQKIKFVPPAGVPVTEWTPKREYCVQFGETDLDFVKRLLEEEGITYLFHSSRGEERLVLVDDVSRFPETPTCDGRAVPTAFAFDSQDPHLEHVMAIRQLAKLRPTRVTLRDFNFSNQALRPDRIEKAVSLNPQLPLANPPLPVGPVPPGLVQAPLVPPDPSSGLPGALVGGVGGGQPYGTVGTTSSLGTDGTELEQYTWPANAVYKYEEEPEKPDPDVARHYKVYDPTAAPPEKKSFIHDPTSPDRDLVRLRMEALIAESQIMRLTTDLAGVMPGTILLLKRGWLYPCPDTPTAQQTQRLLVRRVRHIGNDPQSTIAPPSTDEWFLADASFQNLVEVQWLDPQDPTRTPYRPPLRTVRPVVSGIQTATVVDTSMKDPEDAEQQLHSDHRALGRVMVRFHWDRRGENMLGVNVPFDIQGVSRGHTAWIRVSQPWAGDDYGYSFVPRVGMEVVVAFEDGNPDRPLIIGCVYNGLETPPLGWEKERTHSIVCTRPNPYDDEAKKQEGHPHNELRFVDDRDAEEIRVVARKYLVEEVRHDMWTRVVNDQTNEVVGNHGEIVRNYQHLEVSGDREKTVGSYEIVEIGGQRVAEVHGNDTLEVTWTRDQKIEGAQTVHVGSPEAGEEKRRSLTVYGTRKTDIGFPLDPELGPQNDVFTIEGNEKITVTGTLTVLAGSFGVGMPAAPGSPVHDASMSARTEDELGEAKDTLAIRSQKDVVLEAKGEVALVSEHCGAQLDAGEKLEILAGDSKLVLDASSALGPLTIESAKKVVIECATSKIEITDSSVLLSAKGSPAAEMVFNASGIGMKGGSLALIARAEIEVSGGAIKV